jgi:hypothetical protein
VLGAIVDTAVLAKLVAAALITGSGISAVFALAIYGGTRFVDLRRTGRALAASAFAGFAGLCLAAVTAAVVYGLVIMAAK